MRKYYPNVDRDEVEAAVKFYHEHPEYDDKLGKMTTNKAVAYYESRPIKDDKLLIRVLTAYHSNPGFLNSDKDMEIINILLGNRRLIRKIRIIDDASYLSNSVRFGVYFGKIRIEPSFGLHGLFEFEEKIKWLNLPAKQRLKWIDKHFRTIYVQTPIVTDEDMIRQHIYWKTMMDERLCRR